MKILTSNTKKGGGGKTKFAHNFAEWLRRKYRVLLIDFDKSKNLTNRYGEFDNYDNTVLSLFETGHVTPVHVADNLDLIAGHEEIEDLKLRLMSRRNREHIFAKWLAENQEMLENSYDYIIIDTENDEAVLTENAIIVSDLVVGPAEASKDNITALSDLRSFVSELNSEFDEDTKVAFVANKINLAESASKDLLKGLEAFPEYVGYLPRRTVLADEEAIFNRKLDSSQKSLLAHVDALFTKILERLEAA